METTPLKPLKTYRYFEVIDYSNNQYGIYGNIHQANLRVEQLRGQRFNDDKRFIVNPIWCLKQFKPDIVR